MFRMDFPEDPRVRLQHIASFVVTAGLIALIFGIIAYASSHYADSRWRDTVTPPEVRRSIDDGFAVGRVLIAVGLLVSGAGWAWSLQLEGRLPRLRR